MFLRKISYFKLLFFLLGAILICGCEKKSEQPPPNDQVQTQTSKPSVLILYNWEEYIGSNTLANFEKETGIHVKENHFKDEEEMLGAVQSDLSAYDLVVASDDLIREMREGKILSQIDYSKIPNAQYISKQYRNMPCDPEEKFTVPYLIGTTGLVVNKKYITEDTDSWRVLFEKRYHGRLAMLNNSFEVTAVACKFLGFSINTENREELAKAKELLLDQNALLKGYLDVMMIKKMLINEELWAAQIYSGEGLSAVDENENLAYVIPKEGAPIWIDYFAIPRDAKNKEEAHIFLNYILRPEVNASIASDLWYATPNEAAKALMDREVVESASVYPSPTVAARCEFFKNVGGATVSFINTVWTNLTVKD